MKFGSSHENLAYFFYGTSDGYQILMHSYFERCYNVHFDCLRFRAFAHSNASDMIIIIRIATVG